MHQSVSYINGHIFEILFTIYIGVTINHGSKGLNRRLKLNTVHKSKILSTSLRIDLMMTRLMMTDSCKDKQLILRDIE